MSDETSRLKIVFNAINSRFIVSRVIALLVFLEICFDRQKINFSMSFGSIRSTFISPKKSLSDPHEYLTLSYEFGFCAWLIFDHFKKSSTACLNVGAFGFGLIVGVCMGIYRLKEDVIKFIERVDRMKKGEEFDPFSDALNITSSISVIKTGEKFEASLTGFAALIGHFEADRLRVCEICGRVFWAKRKESKTCSAKCFNNFRQQLYRKLTAEEKAERKSRRKSNRERNKKLKQIKEKKNGTL